MISNAYKKVKIFITTYEIKDKNRKTSTTNETMDRRQKQHESDKRFVCSICLNSPGYNKDNCGKKFAKSCPICRNNYSCNYRSEKGIEIDVKCKGTPRSHKRTDQETKLKRNDRDLNTKNVQTSQTDLTQDLSLLKEVLTVFQTKKIDIKTNNSVVMKDKYVETESNTKTDLTAKLTMSRIFQLSIDEDNRNNENNFKIVNYAQPNNGKSSQLSIDLIKHKSSSIPQMKMEELKYSLKEKVKSKDAIEEVNRMFATVRRHELSDTEEPNRPMVRSGPRVLPVVKTKTDHDTNKRFPNSEVDTKTIKCPVTKIDPINCKKNEDKTSKIAKSYLDNNHKEESETEASFCKCCQTNNMQLSGGDSFFKHECCYHKMMCEGRCEKCIYMLCCHYQKHNRVETGALVCECCRKVSNEKSHGSEGREHCEHF